MSTPQCGRTFPHLSHETTAGDCPGLASDRINAALLTIVEALGLPVREATFITHDSGGYEQAADPWAERPSYAALEAGLRVIGERFGGGCEHFTTGIGSCFRNGRYADARYAGDHACSACIAWQVLRGLPLPSETDAIVPTEPETRLSWCDDGVLLECTRFDCMTQVDGRPVWFQQVLDGWVTPESAAAARDAHVATHGGA